MIIASCFRVSGLQPDLNELIYSELLYNRFTLVQLVRLIQKGLCTVTFAFEETVLGYGRVAEQETRLSIGGLPRFFF